MLYSDFIDRDSSLFDIEAEK